MKLKANVLLNESLCIHPPSKIKTNFVNKCCYFVVDISYIAHVNGASNYAKVVPFLILLQSIRILLGLLIKNPDPGLYYITIISSPD